MTTNQKLRTLHQAVDDLFDRADLVKLKAWEKTCEDVAALAEREGCFRQIGGRMYFTEEDLGDLLHAMHAASQSRKDTPKLGSGWVVVMHAALDVCAPVAIFWVPAGERVEDKMAWFEANCGLSLAAAEPSTLQEFAELTVRLAPSRSHGVFYKRGFGTEHELRDLGRRRRRAETEPLEPATAEQRGMAE